jgi:hypothetical protein
MMLYIIGPMIFQQIVIGLLLNSFGVNYESITSSRNENENKSRQEAA